LREWDSAPSFFLIRFRTFLPSNPGVPQKKCIIAEN
jgi:hypothetical protein